MTNAPALMLEIQPGVAALRMSHVEGWAGLVIGSRRTLAIDAGKDVDEGAAIVASSAALGGRSDLLAYTHGHWDHVRGGCAFKSAEIVAHRDAIPMIGVQLAEERQRAEASDVPTEAGEPTVVISSAVEFRLGEVEAVLLPTPGHAPGAMSVFIPAGRILFAGDTVVTGIPPALGDGDSIALQNTFEALREMRLDIIVPGHGPILRSRGAVVEHLTWSIKYLSAVRELIERLRNRRSLDEIVAAVTFDAFIGARLPIDTHRMVWRHEQVVRRIHDELQGVPG
ncbi:hypothetical protein BH20CHL7_BH20CHL7_03710 [soil metagenome]